MKLLYIVEEFLETALPFFLFIVLAVGLMFLTSTLVKGIGVYVANRKLPKQTLEAEVADKRYVVWDGSEEKPKKTNYYITFQVIDGLLIEYKVSEKVYGQLEIGDAGELTTQGTRYIDYQKKTDQGV